jgi:hypothetical protein
MENDMTASNAKRGNKTLCFYCDYPTGHTSIATGDHFPVPESCGGTETVHACWACHNLKDNISIDQIVFTMPHLLLEITTGNSKVFLELVKQLFSLPSDTFYHFTLQHWQELSRFQRIMIARAIHDWHVGIKYGVKPNINTAFIQALKALPGSI